ncbi:flagellar basal body-associated FliL family protein [Sphingomonas oligoaromativorans]|uniref:flagellar basal body-associated FliL family protein n=1 Tax=Sphingomonas oligoaromativorans TaxID=575322 RepID=UPI00142298F1|nr:flagellar FliL protein [Sphingomonas oligoaromativorans]
MPTTSVIEADVKAGGAPPARSRKRLILAAAGVVALLAAAGGGYAWWSREPSSPSESASGDVPAKAYVDVPSLVVNLRSSDGRAHLLKLHVMLVAADAGRNAAITAKMPLYLDTLQPFLRELRPEDLNGSAAVFRMKEEMLARANDAMGNGMIRDVLIQDLVQQ